MKEIRQHYGEETKDGFYVHTYDNQQYIGLKSDTFEGDSGAAVISRARGTIVGILYAGVSSSHVASSGQTAFPKTVTSTLHERAIPITLIIDDIKKQCGNDWFAKNSVKRE